MKILLLLQNFEHGIFLFYHNLNPLGIPISKIYAPNPDIFFLFDPHLAHRAPCSALHTFGLQGSSLVLLKSYHGTDRDGVLLKWTLLNFWTKLLLISYLNGLNSGLYEHNKGLVKSYWSVKSCSSSPASMAFYSRAIEAAFQIPYNLVGAVPLLRHQQSPQKFQHSKSLPYQFIIGHQNWN